jgi:uncharacterized BrkB/YihY/UPF0761 family membrane protein
VFTAMCVIGLSASMAASWARHSHAALGLAVTVADVVVYTLLALLAFDHLPHPDGISWREQWPGALLAGAGITGVQLFLAYYLAGKLERSPALYGTLGAATVVLLVLFLIARLVVSAMFLNATLQRLRVDSRD